MEFLARSRSQVIGALVLFSILALAGFLYSPWHLHSRIASKACPFSTVEHSAISGDSYQPVHLPPPIYSDRLADPTQPQLPGAVSARLLAVRGPPS